MRSTGHWVQRESFLLWTIYVFNFFCMRLAALSCLICLIFCSLVRALYLSFPCQTYLSLIFFLSLLLILPPHHRLLSFFPLSSPLSPSFFHLFPLFFLTLHLFFSPSPPLSLLLSLSSHSFPSQDSFSANISSEPSSFSSILRFRWNLNETIKIIFSRWVHLWKKVNCTFLLQPVFVPSSIQIENILQY